MKNFLSLLLAAALLLSVPMVPAYAELTEAADNAAIEPTPTAEPTPTVEPTPTAEPTARPDGPMYTITYKDVEFNVVNTAVDPVTFSQLTYHQICQTPNETAENEYPGKCLNFSYYYVYCMVNGITEPDIAAGASGKSGSLSFKKELFSSPEKMMPRLYDLLSAGQPQILMVEAITHKGSRHFLTVVGYRASVTSRKQLKAEDLLLLDTFDGRLQSMDPAIDPVDTRVLFKQDGMYRIQSYSGAKGKSKKK